MIRLIRLLRLPLAGATALSVAVGLVGCPNPEEKASPDASAPVSDTTHISAPTPPASSAAGDIPPHAELAKFKAPCPPEMVMIPAEKPYCIDRWEAIIEEKKSGNRYSPYHSPTPKYAKNIHARWESERGKVGSAKARAMPLPPLPTWQLSADSVPIAVSRPGEIPHGYLSGNVAKMVCENTGKRLCSRTEWVRACRGSADQQFPYGDEYQPGACNIFRTTHPAGVLHNDVTTGHLDPRLNLVEDEKGPLLRQTGETKACASKWGNDAVYDMVGNLDEWIEDEEGVFVGGFFSRGKKDGCSSVVKNHPNDYWDYSLGVRCCLATATD